MIKRPIVEHPCKGCQEKIPPEKSRRERSGLGPGLGQG